MVDEEFVYVVTRDGKRVNYENYKTYEAALPEAKYWTALIHKIVNGNKVDPRSVIKIRKTSTPKKFK
jgi:hypothetical protein